LIADALVPDEQLAEDLGARCGALTDRVVELTEERKRIERAANKRDVQARERLDEIDDDISSIRAEIDPLANAYYEAAIAARRFSFN
jgi:hypothetical protein